MKLERADYLNFAKAGLSVAAVMLVVILVAFRLSVCPASLQQIFGLLLFLPGGLIFMPLIHNIHTSWPGYIFLGVGVNWILYTWGTWALMEKRRRKRESRRTEPTGSGVRPDEISSNQ